MTSVANEIDKAIQSKPMEPLGKAGTKLSLAIHKLILKGGSPVRRIADFLHGTWLGHPLHPVLTDFTIGAWTFGAVFDTIASATRSEEFETTADHLTAAGTISAIPTAITGLVDYSTFPEPSAKPVTLHAASNVVGLTLFALSVSERRRGNRKSGVALSLAGLALTACSAWLGGELVYKYKVGVDHREKFEGPTKWTPVISVDELPDRKPIRIEFDGKGIMLYREGRKISAIGAVCAHAGGPLHEGKINGSCVQCPWHDSVFNIPNGRIVHGPATQPQQAFDVRVRNDQVELRRRAD